MTVPAQGQHPGAVDAVPDMQGPAPKCKVIQGSVMTDILVTEDVARILHCAVDTVRRIPRDELPVYRGPGRYNLYLREDVIRYVRTRRVIGPNIDRMLAEIEGSVISSVPGNVRGRSS